MKIVSSNSKDVVVSTIELEAASWVAQLDSGALSATDRLALAEWQARSPRHALELRKLSVLWGRVDAAVDDEVLGAAQPKLSKVIKAGALVRPKFYAGATIACFALIFAGVMSAPTVFSPQESIASKVAVYAVPKGEDLVQTLSDGSIIHLNTDTQIEVDFSDDLRRLTLIRGEAFFDVAHDEDRPFRVYAGRGFVEAVGTAFIVDLTGDDLDVTVTEGKVLFERIDIGNVSDDAPLVPNVEPVLVAAGHTAFFDNNIAKIAAIETGAIEKETAWRNGQLVFSGDTLAHVVGEIARYSDREIVISDPALREMRLSGVFTTSSDVAPILAAMSLYHGVEATYVGDGSIYLSAK